MLPLQPLDARDPPPPISVSLQGRGETPLLPSTVHAYVALISALILRQGVPLRHPSAKPAPLPLISALLPQRVEPPLQPSAVNAPPLPQLSALPLQRGVPPLQPLAVCAPPPLSVSLQGQGVPPLLPSAVCAHAPMFW